MKATLVNNDGIVIEHEVTSVVFTSNVLRLVFKLSPNLSQSDLADKAMDVKYSIVGIASLVIEEEKEE